MKIYISFLIFVSVVFAQQDLAQNDTRCPANEDVKNPTQFGHATDCEKFFKCLNGKAYVMYLPMIKS